MESYMDFEKYAQLAATHAAEVDRGTFPSATLKVLGEDGLLGLVSAKEVGGKGAGLAEAAELVERLARECASTAMVVCMHFCATAVIEAHGPVEVRKAIAAGKHLTTLAFSEVGSRSQFWVRDLQEEETLKRFIGTLRERQEQLAAQHGTRKPMLLKIAPDLSEAELDGIAAVLLGAHVDGLICTNTTIDRSAIAGARLAGEAGGLSGKPLMAKATAVLRGMAQRLGGRVPLIGVGGITRGADATEKFDAGASLVQFYSGMVYRGPALIGECVEAIRSRKTTG